MRILITGGCGFIGSHFAEYHVKKNDEVMVVDDLSTGSLTNIAAFQAHPGFQFHQGDILTWPGLEKAVAWADRIYHLAAVLGVYRVLKEPINVLTANIMGCERVLKAIVTTQSKARIIIASSSSVYGNSDKPMLNEKNSLIISPNTHPLWGYAVSKIADEALGHAYVQTHHLPITYIRFFNTVGPRQTGLYGMVVPRFVKQACQNEPISVYGDGTQTRSFCDVRDSVIAVDYIAEHNISLGEPINVGNDSEISINDLAKLVKARANSQSIIEHIPYKEAYGLEFNDIKQRRPDLSKLRSLTGFKHQWNLEKTVDDLIKTYRK